jgi:hypothetical protein
VVVHGGGGSVRQACLLVWWRRQCATGLPTYMMVEAVCDRPAYLYDDGSSVRQTCLFILQNVASVTMLQYCVCLAVQLL